nr:PREDICTED: CMT1A duplicated region transcript 4 protein [Struthio camelus australis]
MSVISDIGPKNTLPSVNMGLPSHLIECHHPWPAYTTHTAPVVKMLVEQDELRKTISAPMAGGKPSGVPPEADLVEKTQVPSQLSGGSCPNGITKDSVGKAKSKAESSLPSHSICNRVIFARRPPLHVLPYSSFVCSSKKKSSVHS